MYLDPCCNSMIWRPEPKNATLMVPVLWHWFHEATLGKGNNTSLHPGIPNSYLCRGSSSPLLLQEFKSCTLVLWDPNHLQSLDEDPVFSPGAKSEFSLLVSSDVKASLTDSAKTSLDTYALALQLWFINLCLQRKLDAYILTIVAFPWLKVSVQFGLTLKPSSSSS